MPQALSWDQVSLRVSLCHVPTITEPHSHSMDRRHASGRHDRRRAVGGIGQLMV
jgi:hypothetical protein